MIFFLYQFIFSNDCKICLLTFSSFQFNRSLPDLVNEENWDTTICSLFELKYNESCHNTIKKIKKYHKRKELDLFNPNEFCYRIHCCIDFKIIQKPPKNIFLLILFKIVQFLIFLYKKLKEFSDFISKKLPGMGGIINDYHNNL